ATLEAGKAESSLLYGGGFEWTAGVRRNPIDMTEVDFTLACNNQRGGKWNCEADVECAPLSSKYNWTEKEIVKMSDENCVHVFENMFAWHQFTSRYYGYVANDKIVVEFRINIISAEGNEAIEPTPIIDISKFSSPTEAGNVTLVIGENKLKVSKEFLAFHSPVFAAMFFGNFAENGKQEVEINYVIYEEFIDLLFLIFPLGTVEITDRTVLHILKLADQFQMERVISQSVKHLIQSDGFNEATKLLIADHYRLFALRDHCFNSFVSFADLTGRLMLTPGGTNLSDETKLAIYNRFSMLYTRQVHQSQ
ncbi:hypothetical protein PENTCL1PPCAC_9602, partial [Pristionchus entomophagus]